MNFVPITDITMMDWPVCVSNEKPFPNLGFGDVYQLVFLSGTLIPESTIN